MALSGEANIFSSACRIVTLFFPDIPKVIVNERSIWVWVLSTAATLSAANNPTIGENELLKLV